MAGGQRINDTLRWAGGGEIAGNTSVTACPDVDCKWVKFKAKGDNATTVAVGVGSGTTLPADTDTTTAGWSLAAGEETDWLPVPSGNLSNIYTTATAAGDALLYIYLT